MKIAILSKLLPTASAVEALLGLVVPVLETIQAKHQAKAETLNARADSHRDAAAQVVEKLHSKASEAEVKASEALDVADHALVLAERLKALRG